MGNYALETLKIEKYRLIKIIRDILSYSAISNHRLMSDDIDNFINHLDVIESAIKLFEGENDDN